MRRMSWPFPPPAWPPCGRPDPHGRAAASPLCCRKRRCVRTRSLPGPRRAVPGGLNSHPGRAALTAASGPFPSLAQVLLAPFLAWWLAVASALPCTQVARADALAVPLQCRLDQEPWQSCRMEIQELGLRWLLRIGARRFRFRHDGRGGLRMQSDDGRWRPVEARWQAGATLCWDGVCARGSIPLD